MSQSSDSHYKSFRIDSNKSEKYSLIDK